MITFDLQPAEADYIFNCLAQRPWSEVNGLISNLQLQVKTQQEMPSAKKSEVSQ